MTRTGFKLVALVGLGALCVAAPLRGVRATESKGLIAINCRVLQDGVPIANADLTLAFEVWTAATGGSRVWGPETLTNVPVRAGVLSVKLGDSVPFGPTFGGTLSTTDRWVSVKLGSATGPEIVPRIRLTSVPYAQGAATADVASAIWNPATSSGLDLDGLDKRYINDANELAGAGLENDGAGKLRLSSSAAGNGLTGGSGSALAVGGSDTISVTADAVAVRGGELINGGLAPLDGDRTQVDFSPLNYTRTPGTPGTDVRDLAAHLRGIDVKVGTLSGGGGGSGVVLPETAGGRLSLSNTISATTADVTTNTLYYLPHVGAKVALFDGTAWAYADIAAVPTLAVSTAAVSSAVYDVFLHNATGPTLSLEQWSSTTACNATHDLERQDGVWVKKSDHTRRYLGTVYVASDGGSTKFFRDSAAQRFVWNVQNQVLTVSATADTVAGWTTASTSYVPIFGGDPDWKHELVLGLEEHVVCVVACPGCGTPESGGAILIGIGVNSTTTAASEAYMPYNVTGFFVVAHHAATFARGYSSVQGLAKKGGGTMAASFGGGVLQNRVTTIHPR